MYIRILLSLALVLAAGLAPDTFAQQLFYIHADHLNTPRLVTDGSGTPVWRWDQTEPFGDNLPNEDPDGNGTPGHMPLRFPGQYFDKETNTHYNYFRDYDPAIGRYIQSDPTGIEGGLNTYIYGRGEPLRFIDPTGEISLFGGIALGGAFIVGAMIIQSQQQQGAGGGKKSDDPFSDPSGASSSASSSSSSSSSGGQTLEECKAQCDEDQKERDGLCYSLKFMKDKSKQAKCLRESFEKTVRCYTECRDKCK